MHEVQCFASLRQLRFIAMGLFLGMLEILFLLIDGIVELQQIWLTAHTVKLGLHQPHPTLVFPKPMESLGEFPDWLLELCDI